MRVSYCFKVIDSTISPSYSIAMTPEQRQMVIDLCDPPTAEDDDWEMLDEVLQGDETLGISHEGGELDALTELREHVHET